MFLYSQGCRNSFAKLLPMCLFGKVLWRLFTISCCFQPFVNSFRKATSKWLCSSYLTEVQANKLWGTKLRRKPYRMLFNESVSAHFSHSHTAASGSGVPPPPNLCEGVVGSHCLPFIIGKTCLQEHIFFKWDVKRLISPCAPFRLYWNQNIGYWN